MKIKIAALLFVILGPIAARAQWSAVRYDGQNVFAKVHATDAQHVVVLGNEPWGYEPFLLRSLNGGAAWDSIPLNMGSTSLHFDLVHFTNAAHGVISGNTNDGYQLVRKTQDHGNSWLDITPDAASLEKIDALFFVNAQRGFAQAHQTWYATVDGGATWTSWPVNFTSADLYFVTDHEGFAAGTLVGSNVGAVLKTHDGGATWTTLFTATDPWVFVNALTNINVNDDAITVQHRYVNKLHRSFDGGASWTTVVCDSVWQITDFHFENATRGTVLSSMSQLFSTNDGGESWQLDYAAEWGFYGPLVYFNDMTFINGVGYVCGSTGLVKRFESEATGLATAAGETFGFSLFPNPASAGSGLRISATHLTDATTVHVHCITGRPMRSFQISPSFGVNHVEIPLTGIAPGVYTIVLSDANGVRSGNVLVTK